MPLGWKGNTKKSQQGFRGKSNIREGKSQDTNTPSV